MANRLETMLDEIQDYKNCSFKKNIEDRLNKSLKLYLNELENSYGRVLSKRTESIVKELARK